MAEPKPISESTTRTPPDSGTPLESLFDQIRFNETDLVDDAMNSMLDPGISSLIELNKLTGELTFKKRIDYEELANKVEGVIVIYFVNTKMIYFFSYIDSTVSSTGNCR